jgi:hypothetical protein
MLMFRDDDSDIFGLVIMVIMVMMLILTLRAQHFNHRGSHATTLA